MPLCEGYDAALYDCDGVVYLGDEPVPHAAASVTTAAAAGMRAVYVTNNASRRPGAVAEHLRRLGMPATDDAVVTSAQAAVRLLHESVPAGAAVLVIGSEDFAAEVTDGGYRVVRRADEDVAAVAQGLSVDVGWPVLAEASIALRRGAFWVAANTDSTYPTPRGPVPGCGAFVAALEVATGLSPAVAGKPATALHLTAMERTGATRPLVVGDRLDTDIAMALRAGADSLLVLTGVVDEQALLAAPRGRRPTYVGEDLRAVLVPHASVHVRAGEARCGRSRAWYDGTALRRDPGDDGLRAACALAWGTADDDARGVPVAEGSAR